MPSSEVFFLFTVCWRYAFPPIRRRAAGGEITPSEGVCIAAFGGGDAVPTAEGKRGQDTKHGFLSPLDSPDLPLDATPCGRASKMRGAHRGVWCSKGTPLMEAELFAAERCRPALSGRALLCAANHAS